MSSAFEPTHLVPKGGTRAWENPDASPAPMASLHARTELQVLETDGAWARVLAENGWEGWVDGRVLVPLEGVRPAPEESKSWSPTHMVPAAGSSAWSTPDASESPESQLHAGVRLQIVEELGAWARVVGENGWTGWVDGRTLRPVGPGAGIGPVGVLPLVGAALVLLGSFLPLMSWGGAPITAWQIPLLSLLDNSAAVGWLLTGLVLLPTLMVALPLVTGRPLSGKTLVTLGAIGVDIAFITLLRTGAEDLSNPGVGLFVILAGGLTVIAAAVRHAVVGAKR